MTSQRSTLDEELARARQSLRRDPTNIDLATRYWNALAEGDYRSGRYVIEAYRQAALASGMGGAALVRAYRELFLVSGEGPRPEYFDARLIEALRSYIPDMSETDHVNVQWVLQSVDPITDQATQLL
jgi:hypothetical protein